jgi:hypothetical protein
VYQAPPALQATRQRNTEKVSTERLKEEESRRWTQINADKIGNISSRDKIDMKQRFGMAEAQTHLICVHLRSSAFICD